MLALTIEVIDVNCSSSIDRFSTIQYLLPTLPPLMPSLFCFFRLSWMLSMAGRLIAPWSKLWMLSDAHLLRH
jgi:hypothetical protein